jgi:hypothetical protein
MICFLSLYLLRPIEYKINRQEKLDISTDENNLILRAQGIKIPPVSLEENVVE